MGRPTTAPSQFFLASWLMQGCSASDRLPPIPAKGLCKRKASFTERYLTVAGFLALGQALHGLAKTHPIEAAYFRFVALAGCRRSEARLMKWDWINGECVALPDAKAGPRSIWLGRDAKALLAALPQSCDYVFACKARPLGEATLSTIWVRVVRSAGLETLRVHDLRHNYSAVAVFAELAQSAPSAQCEATISITFNELADAFVKAKEGVYKPLTLDCLWAYLDTQLRPLFGDAPLSCTTTAELAEWFHTYSRTRSGGANQALGQIRTMLIWGKKHGLVPGDLPDPIAPIKKNKRQARGRLLSDR